MWKAWQRWLAFLSLAAILVALHPVGVLPPLVGKPDWHDALPLLMQEPGSVATRDRLLRADLALGHQADALALLAGSPGALDASERRELCRLALATGQPDRAVRCLLPLRTHLSTPELATLANLALQAHDLSAACTVTTLRLARAPSDAEARRQLVALWLARSHPDRALDCFEAGKPWADAVAWNRRGAQLALWAQQPARALPHWLALYAARPDLATGKQALAALVQLQDPRATGFAVNLALASADRDVCRLASDRLARAHHAAQALRMLLWRTERLPRDASAFDDARAAALGQHHLLTAIALQRRWLAVAPTPRAWHRLGQLYAWANSPESALQAYAKALGGHPAEELAWRREALALATPLDDLTSAGHANLLRLAALAPAEPSVWRRLAAADAEAGHWNAAAAAQRRLLALAPSQAAAGRLADWLLRAHRREAAIRLASAHALPLGSLSGVVHAAADAERWPVAAQLLGKAVARDATLWPALAIAREQAGDLTRADDAWRRVGANAEIAFLLRHGARADALRKLDAMGPSADAGELRTRASLATALGRAGDRLAALRLLVRRDANDAGAWLELGNALQEAHDADSKGCFATALRLAPRDVEVLTTIAAQRFYGPDPASADPLLVRLASLKPGVAGLRVLAEWALAKHPAQALLWLRELERRAPDARSALQLGDAEAALGDAAAARESWRRAVGRPGGEAEEEARATALARLGQPQDAEALWRHLYAAYPERAEPALALVRAALARGDAAAARAPLQRARALAPTRFDTRLLVIDVLERLGHERAALTRIRALRASAPQWGDGLLREAEADARLGRFGDARDLGRQAVLARPDDTALRGWYHGLRDQSAGVVQLQTQVEQDAALQLFSTRLNGRVPLSDALQLDASLSQLDWPGDRLALGGLGVGWHGGAWQLNGTLEVPQGESPQGSVAADWRQGTASARLEAESTRWQASTRALALGLRTQRLGGGLGLGVAGWQLVADGHVGLVADQPLAGADLGASWSNDPARWAIAYGLMARHWGAAGAEAGLPDDLLLQTLQLRYVLAYGPFQLQLAPGYGLEAVSGLGAPLVEGRLAADWGPDRSVSLEGAYSPSSLAAGGSAAYQRLALRAGWYF